MTPGEKYSVKIADSEIESYKETFRMFDKVPRDLSDDFSMLSGIVMGSLNYHDYS